MATIWTTSDLIPRLAPYSVQHKDTWVQRMKRKRSVRVLEAFTFLSLLQKDAMCNVQSFQEKGFMS